MEQNSNTSLENNKEMDETAAQIKKLNGLLLPKKDWHVNYNNPNKVISNPEINIPNEKQFYKTSGRGFGFKGQKTPISNTYYKNSSQKRIRSSTIEKMKMGNMTPSNMYWDTNIPITNREKIIFQQKIDELKNEIENKENVYEYKLKVMQKKIEEKENKILKLNKELETIKENNKKEKENSIINIKKNYINIIKDLTKENSLLKSKNEEFTSKNTENENLINDLKSKNKKLNDELNTVNQKYNIFITNDDKNLFDNDIKELIQGYNDKLIDEQNEINSLNEELIYLNQENKKLKGLTKEIIEARNETEIFFLDALNEVKKDLYKLKKEKDKRGSFFPTLKKNYEDNTVKVDIRALSPEMRERILRNLFEKINKGYNEDKYKELNNIMAADISDDEGAF